MTPAGSTRRMETFSYLPPFSDYMIGGHILYILV
jgi:hypothetical protein